MKAGRDAPRPRTLDRVLSKAGLASRTEALRLIESGRVRVNGRTSRDPEAWIRPGRDRVTLDGRPLGQAAPAHVLLYKPKGVITTRRDPSGRRTVFDLLPDERRYLFAVGRLDLDTSGLLLMTNDAQLAERMTNPDFEVPKTYLVKASAHLEDEQLAALAAGVELKDGPTRPARVRRVREAGGRTVFEITLREGRNRQVRRMVEALGAKVLKLVRVRLGPLTLAGLEPGRFRELTAREVASLRRAAGLER